MSKKYDTTMKYYIKSNALSRETLKKNMECLGYDEAEKPVSKEEKFMSEIIGRLKK